ncbi:MT-A70-domain-containing protein [Bisporella sp. PMI_857]|nr:MT-A70-domain-containing protein [Bisporella sp. PMI_857]
MESSILFQNDLQTITVLDLPQSIEIAQGVPSTRKLVSLEPLEQPYPSTEPISEKSRAKLPQRSLHDLLLQKHLELALKEARNGFQGRKCSQKITLPITQLTAFIPPFSVCLQGTLAQTVRKLEASAPVFNLMIMDPPWPNRSARRKSSYVLSESYAEVRNLLLSIPICTHLHEDGLVGIWVTNKPAFREVILGENGLFKEWGIQLIEEWVWLKVTLDGRPIYPLNGVWRKPYEILLLGRKGSHTRAVERRVIIGVPDLHSRKPNLRSLLEAKMGKKSGEYQAVEIFARNLTAGWWSWGDEALKFQTEEHWFSP